jgi:hypothetical protein
LATKIEGFEMNDPSYLIAKRISTNKQSNYPRSSCKKMSKQAKPTDTQKIKRGKEETSLDFISRSKWPI